MTLVLLLSIQTVLWLLVIGILLWTDWRMRCVTRELKASQAKLDEARDDVAAALVRSSLQHPSYHRPANTVADRRFNPAARN